MKYKGCGEVYAPEDHSYLFSLEEGRPEGKVLDLYTKTPDFTGEKYEKLLEEVVKGKYGMDPKSMVRMC